MSTESEIPLIVKIGEPTGIVHTADGSYVEGKVLVNREPVGDEVDHIRDLTTSLGLETDLNAPQEGERSDKRSFGPPRTWNNSKWQPNPIWGQGNARNN